MNLRTTILQFVIATLLCAVVTDVALLQADFLNEQHSVLMIDAESEDDSFESVQHLVPSSEEVILLFTSLSVMQPQALEVITVASNFSPHGWDVPIYIDDCVYRI